MKSKLITLSLAGALAFGTAAALQAGDGAGCGRGMHMRGGPHRMGLEHVTKELELTPQQQAQVAPIVEQAKPQLRAIHQDAMQKSQAVLESSAAQIRPLLTPEQQQKLDSLQQAHAKMREAMHELHAVKSQ